MSGNEHGWLAMQSPKGLVECIDLSPSFPIQTNALIHLKRKMPKEVEEMILRGKAVRITSFPKATFTIKCQNT